MLALLIHPHTVCILYIHNTLCPIITEILFCLQMEATKTDKKPCCRKYRQPHKLEAEYRGWQCDKSWLETHIWHTKRMHMVDKWSYRLAEHCNDKGVRATYRYLSHGCLVLVSTPLNYLVCCLFFLVSCNQCMCKSYKLWILCQMVYGCRY